MDVWQNLTNITYGFTDPKDPAKERTLQGASKKISLQKDYEQLDITLHELVKSGQIKNRAQMIELLNENEIFVNRVGSDYISLKLPDSKKARRYKGGIYSEEFRSIGEFENISKRTEQRIDEYNRRDTQGEIRFFTDKLNEYTERKAEYIKSKYKRRIKSKEQTSVSNNGSIKFNSVDYNNDILFAIAKSNTKFTDLASTFKFTIHRAESKVYKNSNKRSNTKPRQINNIYQNQGIKNDSIGTSTKSRATKEREAKYRAYLKNRKARDRVYQQIVGDTENLRNKFREYSEQQHRNKQSIFTKIGALGRIIAKLANKLKSKIVSVKIEEQRKPENLDFNGEIIGEFDKKVRRNK